MTMDLGPLPPGARVSDHLSWAEATCTDHREFLDEQANPPAEIRSNLVRWALDLFEPARTLVGSLRVFSCYRCPGLNYVIGGSKTSRHMMGLAGDLLPVTMRLQDAFRRLVESAIPYDQAIFEFSRWTHLGAAPHGQDPRRQALMIFTPGNYEPFDAADPRFRGVE